MLLITVPISAFYTLYFLLAGTTQIGNAKSEPLWRDIWFLTLILIIIGIITLVVILTQRERKRFEGICKPIGKISPEDFYVGKPKKLEISEQEYIQAFAQRLEDKLIQQAIVNRSNVLILGKTMQGKSREAFQGLYELRGKMKSFWFIRPQAKRDIKNVPKKNKAIIFLDDLDRYADEKFELADFKLNFKEAIVIATCRSGDEFEKACDKYSHEIEDFKKVKLEHIKDNAAKELAQKTKRTLDEFDGTPGSIILGLGVIKEKINGLSEEAKAILKAINLLAIPYIYFPSIKLVKGVSEKIFEAPGIQYEDNLKLLIEIGLIIEHKNLLRIWHDKYFDFIDFHFDIEYLSKLRQILFNLKETDGFLSLSAWYGNNEYLDEVIKTCNKAIELNPKFAEAFYNRGLAYSIKGDLDKVIADYTRAIELNPKYVAAFNNRGVAYKDKGELDKAISDYNKAIELNPKFAEAFYNRGIAYKDKGELDKAISDYNKAIELNPKEAAAMAMLGNVYEMKKDKEKAKYLYEQALGNKDQLIDWQIQEVQNWLKELDKQ